MILKRFILGLAVCFSTAAMAQSGLQFNQVLLVSTQQTVPNGKVWKVENVGSSIHTPSTTSSSSTPAILVNGVLIYLSIVRTTNSSDFLVTGQPFFPMWLPAGTTLQASNGINFVSVVEFDEIP